MSFMPRTAGVLGILVFCGVSRAWAQQTPPAQQNLNLEAAVGYVYMHDSEFSGFWRGWTASFAAKVAPPIAIVGEVGGSYRRNAPEFEVKRSILIHPLLVGPRFVRPNGTVRPFVQLLGGITRRTLTSDPTGHGAQWERTVQPGAGVDFDLNRTQAFRIEGDYRFLQNPLGDRHEGRLVAGFTFRFAPK
jgi:hypothetical protein